MISGESYHKRGLMKIIHCADLHLDSKMTARLDSAKAKERKQELLRTFQRMVAYANDNKVSAIMIAGDMFDTKSVLKTTQNVILNEIKTHSNIVFYYLKGNHDTDTFISNLDEIPENLKLFDEEWKSYSLSNEVVITGMELSKENSGVAYTSLLLDNNKINIVMLHGQESESSSKDKTEIISLKDLQNKGIDYLALGHIHSYKMAELDKRGKYCYPGCLEGRGFDECGTHGFVLIDIDEETKILDTQFVPFADRELYALPVDISGCMDTTEIINTINVELAKQNIDSRNMVKVVLTGYVDVECDKNIGYVNKIFESKSQYYYMTVKDESKLRVDIEKYALDISLKGEFVRTVKSCEDLSDEDKNAIIRYGLQILEGEEVE